MITPSESGRQEVGRQGQQPMTTRRDFCKSLLAAGIAYASLPAFAKSYCGIDFGKDGDCGETVWGELIHGCYFTGGYMSRQQAHRKFWKDLLAQVRPEDLVGGRGSTKSSFWSYQPPKPREKSKREKLEEEYRRIWFEEASEFDNWQHKEREL